MKAAQESAGGSNQINGKHNPTHFLRAKNPSVPHF